MEEVKDDEFWHAVLYGGSNEMRCLENVLSLAKKAQRLQAENYSLRQDLEELRWMYEGLCK